MFMCLLCVHALSTSTLNIISLAYKITNYCMRFCVTDRSSQFDTTITAVSVVSIALKWIALSVVLFWTKKNDER